MLVAIVHFGQVTGRAKAHGFQLGGDRIELKPQVVQIIDERRHTLVLCHGVEQLLKFGQLRREPGRILGRDLGRWHERDWQLYPLQTQIDKA